VPTLTEHLTGPERQAITNRAHALDRAEFLHRSPAPSSSARSTTALSRWRGAVLHWNGIIGRFYELVVSITTSTRFDEYPTGVQIAIVLEEHVVDASAAGRR
jgi:hypothetical protein